MSKAGRKRKICHREPSGRPQRVTKIEALNKMNQERTEQVISVALNQPHRKGSRSQWRESVFGRFCDDHKLRESVYDAGNSYADLLRRWRAAKGVPTELRLGIGGNGEGPSDATVAAWSQRIVSVRKNVIRSVGGCTWLMVESLAVDNIDLPQSSIMDGIAGLAALAVEMGNMPARVSPFRT
jgi:hypothetical protein